jgi:sugar phosphate isomerase/epimerase
MKIGFTTVTFRDKSIDENIAFAVRSGADGIEWGGDVHVLPGEVKIAAGVRRQCDEYRLEVFSYGSYLHCKEGEDVQAVIDTANALGAPLIRVWAYDKSPGDTTREAWNTVVKNLRSICQKAAGKNIKIALEYHRGTLTENRSGTLLLLRDVGEENLYTYWQPNPELPEEEALQEIVELSPYLANFHVFNWHREQKKDIRYPLMEAKTVWENYIGTALAHGRGPEALILEFVKDDAERYFLEDMRTLCELRDVFTEIRK